ncbi:MAG TPA: hypothetical protein VKQ30_06085 [Ktedonobacterales bacterium]|nr:hypothetical protein [Ktedonobacterales bacterium]
MRQKRGPALRWGGIFGGSAAVLAGVLEVLTKAVLDDTLATEILAGVGFFLVYLALFFAAGALAARETGLVRTGTLAGLFAALIASAASILAGILNMISQPGAGTPPAGSTISLEQYRIELAGITAGAALALLVIFLAFGVAFGALGGVAGRPDMLAPPVGTPDPQIPLLDARESAAPAVSPLDAETASLAEVAEVAAHHPRVEEE